VTDSKDRHMRVALLDDFHVVQNVVNIFIDGIDVYSSSFALSVSHCETKRRDKRYFPADFILLNNLGVAIRTLELGVICWSIDEEILISSLIAQVP
jgi:hypothetical protein